MQEHYNFVTPYEHQLVMFAPRFEVETLIEVTNTLSFPKQVRETVKNKTKFTHCIEGKSKVEIYLKHDFSYSTRCLARLSFSLLLEQ